MLRFFAFEVVAKLGRNLLTFKRQRQRVRGIPGWTIKIETTIDGHRGNKWYQFYIIWSLNSHTLHLHGHNVRFNQTETRTAGYRDRDLDRNRSWYIGIEMLSLLSNANHPEQATKQHTGEHPRSGRAAALSPYPTIIDIPPKLPYFPRFRRRELSIVVTIAVWFMPTACAFKCKL